MYHELLKFTFDISNTAMHLLNTIVYKCERFDDTGILDIKTFIKPTNTFQFLDRKSSQNQTVFNGFIKGETIRHIRNTSGHNELAELLENFKQQLTKRGYQLAEINKDSNETELIYSNQI